jgi:uncharacterized membrane protein (UPF0182 family)
VVPRVDLAWRAGVVWRALPTGWAPSVSSPSVRVRPMDVSRRRWRYPGGRAGAALSVGALVALLLSLRGIAELYTNGLWFSSLHITGVWARMVGTQVGLALSFSAAFFVAMWANLALVDRLAPPLAALRSDDEVVQRYRIFTARRPILIRTVVSAVLALAAGSGASAEWQSWLLFTHGVPFGARDPLFHKDIGFFVFRLPFLSFLAGWAFVATIVIAAVVGIAHYLTGGIRLQGPGQRVSRGVKSHLSLLLALVALVKAAGYWLARYQLDLSTQGYQKGAFYTDVHARLPGLDLLIFVALVCAAVLLANMRRPGWVLPGLAVALWALVSLVLGAIYPAAVQAFTVQPAQLAREGPYLARNITATRAAMGLNGVKVQSFADSSQLTVKQASNDLATLRDVRLWDPDFTQSSYDMLEELRPYYRFGVTGLDRYNLDGVLTPTILSVRQIADLPSPLRTWVNEHLQYTHGNGAVLSPANQATVQGNPSFVVRDVPPVSSHGAPVIRQPAVYFGTGLSGYVIANSKQPELDYESGNGTAVEGHYKGSGGVALGGFWRRAAFALRFGSINPLISPLLTPQSRVLFVRDIRQRVELAAPFLAYDSSPYPVIANGRILYVVDAYTTTDNYPYGEEADTEAVPSGSGLDRGFNYVRNSVKVVIDAYSGAMTFYVVNKHDPIIQAWERVFPHLFTPASRMPVALKAQLRYPYDLFAVQAAMLGRYHVTSPAAFYGGSGAWSLAPDPGVGPVAPAASLSASGRGGAAANGGGAGPSGLSAAGTAGPESSSALAGTGMLAGGTRSPGPMPPIYQVSRLPDDSSLTFNLSEAYVDGSSGASQQDLTGFLVARSTPGNYGNGQLELYQIPGGAQHRAPGLMDTEIMQDPQITSAIGSLDRHGSRVLLGTVLMVPVGQTLLYIRPVYVYSGQEPALFRLQRVIVMYGDRSAMAPTLAGAMAELLGRPVPGLGYTSGVTSPGASPGLGALSPAVASLIQQADTALAQAQADLGQRDLSGYQHEVNVAQQLLEQAQKLEAQASGASQRPPSSSSAGGGSGTTSTTAAA